MKVVGKARHRLYRLIQNYVGFRISDHHRQKIEPPGPIDSSKMEASSLSLGQLSIVLTLSNIQLPAHATPFIIILSIKEKVVFHFLRLLENDPVLYKNDYLFGHH